MTYKRLSREIKLADGLVIVEKKKKDHIAGALYEYFIANKYVFGVVAPFTESELKALYENGYFDFWLYDLERG